MGEATRRLRFPNIGLGVRTHVRNRRQVAIEDLARLQDRLSHGGSKQYYRRWEMNTMNTGRREKRAIVQDDMRLKRIKGRAEGIRFALRYEDINDRQRKEMEQTLHNLELAATGIEKVLKSR